MPKVEISQSHNVTAEEAKKRLQQLSEGLKSKYDLSSNWVSDTEVQVKRTGATGNIKIEPTAVKVFLDLSFALTPMKSTIENKIKEELKKLFEA